VKERGCRGQERASVSVGWEHGWEKESVCSRVRGTGKGGTDGKGERGRERERERVRKSLSSSICVDILRARFKERLGLCMGRHLW
jgi:hypothetical protein